MKSSKIHISVLERITNGTGCYAPLNLPHHCEVVSTNDDRSWPSDQTRWAIERLVRRNEGMSDDPGKHKSLLDGMRGAVRSGKMSYYIFVAASIPAVGWWYGLPTFPQMTDAIVQWSPYPNLIIGGLYACVGSLVWGWSKRVDERMESAAQNHWQRYREALRKLFAEDRTLRESESSVDEAMLTAVLAERARVVSR